MKQNGELDQIDQESSEEDQPNNNDEYFDASRGLRRQRNVGQLKDKEGVKQYIQKSSNLPRKRNRLTQFEKDLGMTAEDIYRKQEIEFVSQIIISADRYSLEN